MRMCYNFNQFDKYLNARVCCYSVNTTRGMRACHLSGQTFAQTQIRSTEANNESTPGRNSHAHLHRDGERAKHDARRIMNTNRIENNA